VHHLGQGFSEKLPLLLATVAAAVYRLEITQAELGTVLEVHR
jgi:hypothetical protein